MSQEAHRKLLGRLLGPPGPELTCEQCFDQLDRYVGSQPVPDAPARYVLPAVVPQNGWGLLGTWTLGGEHTTAGKNGVLALHFHAKDVYLVLGGHGHVGVYVNGRRTRTIAVRGIDRLYTVLSTPHVLDAQLRLTVSPGISVYSFTFG